MTFLAPHWLLGLLPWLAIAAWLLLGRRERRPVPFLPLWQGPVVSRQMRQALQAPPLALLLVLAALLLALLAAARPVIQFAKTRGDRITILVDDGATLSATVPGGSRLAALADSLHQPLLDSFGPGTVELIDLPRGDSHPTDRDHWPDAVRALPPTGVDTSGMVRPTVASLLAREPGPIIVLTDHPTAFPDDGLIEIPPAASVENIGIVKLALRGGAHPQLMVTVRNQSSQTAGALRLISSRAMEMPIALPPRDHEQDYFFDAAPPLSDIVQIELAPADSLPVDNTAWLVRERNNPKIEPSFALPDVLRRMVDVYEKSRPPGTGSRAVAVVRDFPDLPAGEPGVAVADPALAANASPVGPVTLSPHPITAALQPEDFTAARVSLHPPTAAGWEPVVSIGGHPAVMARSTPSPQVWVGFDSPTWGRTPAYIIFWTNLLDWIGGPPETFVSYPLTHWSPEWRPRDPHDPHADPGLWPGIYRNGAGELRAFNTLDLNSTPPPPSPWCDRLRALAATQPRGFPAATVLLFTALIALLLAAMTWQKKSTPAAPHARPGAALRLARHDPAPT